MQRAPAQKGIEVEMRFIRDLIDNTRDLTIAIVGEADGLAHGRRIPKVFLCKGAGDDKTIRLRKRRMHIALQEGNREDLEEIRIDGYHLLLFVFLHPIVCEVIAEV